MAAFLTGTGRDHTIVNIPAAPPHMDISVRFAGEAFDSQVRAVEQCIEHDASSLLFVNTRSTAEALGHRLYERGDVEVHHGSLSKEIRIDAEDRFKRGGEIRSLICTSSMELGIDIGHVERVIQFGSPREVSRLLQRVGRAGHRLDTVSHGTVLATGFDDLGGESLVISVRPDRTSPRISISSMVHRMCWRTRSPLCWWSTASSVSNGSRPLSNGPTDFPIVGWRSPTYAGRWRSTG
ncbi:helicase-related protein [Methanogenium cariaci]|uniref:helicase-related protein n=1 Tax=Methanogenium cariaci TaxID=2197 RepID=UPI000AC91806|nr:helicase-related protein [Methanogenium cariaci]